MNFKAIKRAEELRLNIENKDREIIELEKVMHSLATQDEQRLTLSLSVSSPVHTDTGRNFKSGSIPVKSIDTDYGSLTVFDSPPVGFMSGIFKAMEEVRDNEERIIKAPSRSSFDITNSMALEFLEIYHRKILGERALSFKLLEECIKTLQLIN